jgi:hypothetical protein
MLSKMFKQCRSHKVQVIQCLVRSTTSNLIKDHESVSFDSISAAYGYKSKRELFRGWVVFKLCSYKSFVNHLSQVNHCINLIFILFSKNLVIYYFTYCSWSTIIRVHDAFNHLWTFCCGYK